MLYADVIMPLSLQDTYTYSVPRDIQHSVSRGSRVIVQFGKKKFYTAIVLRLYEEDEKEGIKEIAGSLEDYPIVSEKQLDLWQWIASYYMCALGDVYRAALPSALKLESETYVVRNPDFEAGEAHLTPNEQKVLDTLSSTKALKISEIEKASQVRGVIQAVKSLSEKEAVFLSETVHENYSPKKQAAIRLVNECCNLDALLDGAHKYPKQYALLSTFRQLYQTEKVVLKKQLLEKAHVTAAVLQTLVKKEVLQVYDYEVNRIDYGATNIDAAFALNAYQQAAYDEIKASFAAKDVTLLHGVTSSGKTEIYIQLIKETIAQGGQVLYLLPEIALTTQITNRLKAVFGNKLAVYHSRFNDNERVEAWNRLLLDAECQIILGARSAVFMPFTDLRLVIVDEEHESSYKQQEPAPRYHARNVAMVLASMFGAKTLLGTATPAIESYYNALSGRYGLVQLTKRHADIALPEIQVVNVKELRRTKQMKSILSPLLIANMDAALEKKEQIILFQNRRGFSSMLECKTCSWTPQCSNCDVSLTYHKGQRVLACHYCGAVYSVPHECPECKTPTLDTQGYGTERIEEEVNVHFPLSSTLRMDLDTTRGKRAYERIISDFESHKADILIGTQMVSKGLDFEGVSVVGIINADNLLNYPDFRAHERAFQLITQVSGRAGRKNKQGLVLLQTGHPAHPVITCAVRNDYERFYHLQLDERQLFRYPPFYRLIEIVIRGKYEQVVDKAARHFAQSLRASFGKRVLGPAKPPVARVQTLYIRKIILKVEHQASIAKVREVIRQSEQTTFENPDFKSLLLHYDVDPL
ncbi:primosomal protein N' [Dysgonomonas sp. 25]|uniref:replication restart helicase PriA n=1 Tax=Dysgonomonas sp. 25 TaxID=2302933 RepID=UPI0013CFCA61|nr:primosomal protein N' [Dysgonomonas sp. 25]NDV68941.1 primosomal protein N' [Dysgonomonas sp. 25]